MKTERRVSVLLVDRHEVVRRGLRAALEAEPGLAVIAEFVSLSGAATIAGSLGADLLLAGLADREGSVAVRKLVRAKPDVPVLTLTDPLPGPALVDLIEAGARGIVLRSALPVELVRAVRAVAAGGTVLDPSMTDVILDGLPRANRAPHGRRDNSLSSRERRVLDRLGRGETNRQIASELHLAQGTIRNQVSALLAKLGVRSRVEAAAYAARLARTPASFMC